MRLTLFRNLNLLSAIGGQLDVLDSEVSEPLGASLDPVPGRTLVIGGVAVGVTCVVLVTLYCLMYMYYCYCITSMTSSLYT